MVKLKTGLSLMSVPNFRKSYHTVLGAAIDSHGTNIIIIPTNIAASSDADSSKDCETRGKCIFFTILERRVKVSFSFANKLATILASRLLQLHLYFPCHSYKLK